MTTLTTRADKGSALTHNEMDTNLLIAIPTVSSKSSNYTVVVGDEGDALRIDTTSGDITVTLPPAATAGNGFSLIVQKGSSDGNTVIIDADGSETINGQTTFVLAGQYITYHSISELISA